MSWFLSAVVLVCAGGLSAASSLEAILARSDQTAAVFKGLTANLKKVSHTAVINEDTTDIGTITVQRVNPRDVRMLMQIREPDPKDAAIHDHKAEVYYPKTQTVQEFDLGAHRDLVDQFLLLGFGSSSRELRSAYSIEFGGPEAVEGQPATRITLTPTLPEMLTHLKKVDLWISDSLGVAVQQKFYEPGGDYIMATYTNVKVNPNLLESAVRLNLPKGVKREHPAR
jgi:outer membrane lipoprotein-sorting protein